jgi:hypothetical protein
MLVKNHCAAGITVIFGKSVIFSINAGTEL